MVLVAFLAVLTTLIGPSSTAEATSYRYWTYWTGGDGTWTFSSQGAARRPPDGTVDGWRFAISEEAGSSATPRVASSFADICADTRAEPGKKRVAVVLDFGTSADAPPGDQPPASTVARCVVAATTATGYDLLATLASIRAESGLVCGIAGYPSTGCGEPVAPTPQHSGGQGGEQSGSGPKTGGGTGNVGGGGSEQANQAASEPPSPASDKTVHAKGDGDSARHAGSRKNDGTPPRSATPAASNQPSGTSRVEESAIEEAVSAQLPAQPKPGSPLGVLVAASLLIGVVALAWIVHRRRG